MPLQTLQSARSFGFGKIITAAGDSSFESIASTVISSSTSSVTFSSIPGTFQHLHLRLNVRTVDGAVGGNYLNVYFNNDTASGYSYAYNEAGNPPSSTNFGTGASTSNTQAYSPYVATNANASSYFGPIIMDIFDYANTNKRKTFHMRGFFHDRANSRPSKMAGHWRDASAITSIKIEVPSGNYVNGSSFALYGIKNS
jgi:hypothetical protein